jgi:type I restriction enzyme S subunit
LYSTYIDIIKDAEYKPMVEVAPIIRRPVNISAEEKYPELGIRCFGNGTFHKPALSGIEVGTKKLFQIKTGDLVFSNVFAWEGGIAVAKEEDNDRYGSHRFISCNCNLEQVKPLFLSFHFLAPKGLEEINNCSPGGAGRNKTLGLKKLEALKVPVPKIDKQRKFENLLNQFNQLKEQREEREKELTKLIPSLLDKAFKGEL